MAYKDDIKCRYWGNIWTMMERWPTLQNLEIC